MFEQIDQLESRVDNLMRLLEEGRHRAEELAEENRQLLAQLEAKAEVEERNAQLQQQLEALENNLEESGRKEAQIRERLMGMLGRIDSLESEIHSGGAGGQG